jgi:hypothetical protein
MTRPLRNIESHLPARSAGRPSGRSRGTSIIEFTLVLPLLLIMILALIEFGHLIQARLIVANVSREGGSMASRTITIDAGLANLVAVSGHPLILNGADGKVIITRIDAGESSARPTPIITSQVSAGSLGQASAVGAGKANFGLPANLYSHLVYLNNPVGRGSDIAELTMVEVYYKYRPITPLPKFVPGLIAPTGLTLQSRAIF